jgi:hypothetical protein
MKKRRLRKVILWVVFRPQQYPEEYLCVRAQIHTFTAKGVSRVVKPAVLCLSLAEARNYIPRKGKLRVPFGPNPWNILEVWAAKEVSRTKTRKKSREARILALQSWATTGNDSKSN